MKESERCTTHLCISVLAAADSHTEKDRSAHCRCQHGTVLMLDACFPMQPQGRKCAQLKLSWGWILEVCPWNKTRHQHWPRRWNYIPYNTVRTRPESKCPVGKRNMKSRRHFHIINYTRLKDGFRKFNSTVKL